MLETMNPARTYRTSEARRLIESTMNTKISLSTVYRLIHDGRLFSQRIGSRVVIPHGSLYEFLERCQRGERY